MFYQQFVSLCQKKGVSPSRAALDNGISKTSVFRWKNGAIPNMEIVKKLATYFSVTVSELIDLPNQKQDVTADDVRLALLGVDKDGNRLYKQTPSDDDIKFALFGTTQIDDDVLNEVKRFAMYLKDKKENND